MIGLPWNTYNFVIWLVFFAVLTYNKSVIKKHWIYHKSVMGCIYGTIDFEETAELEKFSLSQTFNFERCAPSRQDLDSERIRQTLLRQHCLFQLWWKRRVQAILWNHERCRPNFAELDAGKWPEDYTRKNPHYFWRGTGLPQGHQFHEVFLWECSAVSHCLRRFSSGNCLSKTFFFSGR